MYSSTYIDAYNNIQAYKVVKFEKYETRIIKCFVKVSAVILKIKLILYTSKCTL